MGQPWVWILGVEVHGPFSRAEYLGRVDAGQRGWGLKDQIQVMGALFRSGTRCGARLCGGADEMTGRAVVVRRKC